MDWLQMTGTRANLGVSESLLRKNSQVQSGNTVSHMMRSTISSLYSIDSQAYLVFS